MFGQDELPDSPLERARMLQNMLISRATGGMPQDAGYQETPTIKNFGGRFWVIPR